MDKKDQLIRDDVKPKTWLWMPTQPLVDKITSWIGSGQPTEFLRLKPLQARKDERNDIG